jgi:calcineurin-like phosphoesterase family protein
MIWFTSDTHYHHAKILAHCPRTRPYGSVAEMDAALVANWNACVGPDDTVYHLGDVTLTKNAAILSPIFARLQGNKFLVPGNHDHWLRQPALKFGWHVLPPIYELRVDNHLFILSHFPLLTWHGAHRGAWMLHGHCHGNVDALNSRTTRLDVGVDSHNCRPISLDHVRDILTARQYDPVDHHKQEVLA